MKNLTIALSVVAVLALSACAAGVDHCNDRTAGNCVTQAKADTAFQKSSHK